MQKFWSAKYQRNIYWHKPGEKVPEGAQLIRGKQGGEYFFYPQEATEKKKRGRPSIPGREGRITLPKIKTLPPPESVRPIPGFEKANNYPLEAPKPISEPEEADAYPSRDKKRKSERKPSVTFSFAWANRGRIDWQKMKELDLEFPNPENLHRIHSHSGDTDFHPVNKVHNNRDTQSSHRDERIDFERLYYGPVTDWLDELHIDVSDVNVRFADGKPFKVTKYRIPNREGSPVVYMWGSDPSVHIYHNGQKTDFERAPKALDYIKDIFQKKNISKQINTMITKQLILQKLVV